MKKKVQVFEEFVRINVDAGYKYDIDRKELKNARDVCFCMGQSENLGIPDHASRRRVRDWGMSVEKAVLDCVNLRKRGVNKRNAKKSTRHPQIKSKV